MNSAARFVHRTFQTKYSDLSRNEVFNVTLASRRPKKGDPTSLSVNSMPIIKREVKRRLTRKEQCCIQDFDLETYIVELALLNYSFYTSNPLLRCELR
jgi:hypothetical protein